MKGQENSMSPEANISEDGNNRNGNLKLVVCMD
jgi:hypothetical protein